jgi:transposase
MVMPRLPVRKIREVLRLRFESCLPYERNAESCDTSATSTRECVARFHAAGLAWPAADELDDGALEARLYPSSGGLTRNKPEPDWNLVHGELRKKSVTKELLWFEYKEAHPNGYQYTQFCHYYNQWRKKLDLVFRNEHHAGEKVFVDYAGQTVTIYSHDGTTRDAQIFIGVLGASNYTFCEATWTQGLQSRQGYR